MTAGRSCIDSSTPFVTAPLMSCSTPSTSSPASPPSCHVPAPISPDTTACSPRTSNTAAVSSPSLPIKPSASLMGLVLRPCAGCSGSSASSTSTSNTVACVAARCGLSRASRRPSSSRGSSPISPPATPAASTTPAHRRSMHRKRNPRPSHHRRCPDRAPAGAPQPRCASPAAPLGLHLPDIRSRLPAPNRVTSTAICLFPHRHRTRQRPHRYSHNNLDRRVVLPIRTESRRLRFLSHSGIATRIS